MKILYHHRIASKDGQYVHVEELTNALMEQGNDIVFVAPGLTQQSSFGHDGGVVTKLKKMLPQAVYELLELSYSALIAYKLVREILRSRPDFIYERYNTYQPMGVIISKLFKIPLLLEVNAPLVDERIKHSGLSLVWLAKKIERFTWKNATRVFPVTNVLADILITEGVKKENIEVIHNGINENVLESVFKNEKNASDDVLVIGFVGFINKWHRLDLAIEAISSFPDMSIRLVCVGDGDIRSDLEAQSKRLGLEDKILFTGLKSRDEVFDYIKDFDIALQPSVTPYASPLKLFEYLSAGCLVIAPRSENICEVLNDGNSILFDPDNYEDFYKKLYSSIESFNEMKAVQVMAKQTIYDGGYTWQQNARRVVNMAKSVI
ncbi:MAG: glycosyltransferase family 4 protein [Pseudomonadota bacterium]